MILEAMVGLSLVLNVSLATENPTAPDPSPWLQLSVRQKDAALLPLVRRATDCICARGRTVDRAHRRDGPAAGRDQRPDHRFDHGLPRLHPVRLR